jgi:hypothetical protein
MNRAPKDWTAQEEERVRVLPKPVPVEHRRTNVVMATRALVLAEPAPAPVQPARRAAVGSSAAEKAHMGRVAALGCLICAQPAEVHHVREGQGMAQRASNWLTVPLCPEHHRGASGVHGLGERGFERRYRLSELDLLAMTLAALARGAA